ncbi:MAG: ABC transporter ATP-binding protein [Phycisphaerae bacterium]|nr:ABC transporter ATP-binding protein [Phycisphaerae bacterium]
MTSAAIDLTHVSKTYGRKVRALRDISMHVRRGEIFGLLGPNGAGKSTLVKILMTVIRPTHAKGSVLGSPVGDKGVLARVGYLPEHHRFPEYLTGRQVIEFYGAMGMVPRPDRRRRAAELLELVGMTQWADTRVKGYSKGMRQRIGIAQSLVNNPDLVVLDEPTDGVDPVGRRDIRQVLTHLKSQGRTVFLNSHLLSELEMVCDRVAILVQGVVSSQGTIDELTHGQQRYVIEIDPASRPAAADALAGLGRECPAPPPPGRQPPGLDPAQDTITVPTIDAAEVQPVIDALRRFGVIIRSVRPVRPSLEDLFMQAITDPTTGRALAPGAESSGRKARRGATA